MVTLRKGSATLAMAGAASAMTLAGVPDKAAAWASADRFSDSVLEAGGGGRFFTGSPVDAYTCGDCHSGGGVVPVELVFPQTYTPGATYEVMVQWPTVDAHQVAASLEVVDEAGRPAGTLVVPETDIPDAAYCEAEDPADLWPAAVLKDGSATGAEVAETDTSTTVARQIVVVEACGAHTLYAHWTAPIADVGQLSFVGGVVAGNSTGAEEEYVDATGDAVALIRRQVPVVDHQPVAPEIQFECAAMEGRPGTGAALGFGVLLAPALLLLRRRRR